MFACITPMGFAVNAAFTRYLKYERNFNPTKIQFSAAMLMSIISLGCALIFWQYHTDQTFFSFNYNLFCWGFAGGIVNILGIVCLQTAIT